MFKFQGETRDIAEARDSAPGRFVELPDGVVHYELAGPESGQTVVLVHGFSVPYFLWDPTFDALVAAGFRVLRYDLYGRGYSDRPDVAYNCDLFDRQLAHLLTALAIPTPVNLAGLSMGGAIATVFAHRHPALVRRLVLIDPAGLPQKQPLKMHLLKVPVIGELIMNLVGNKVLLNGLRSDPAHPERTIDPAYVEQYRRQMQYRGFKRALISTMRSRILTGVQDAYRGVGQQSLPVLLIWGRLDTVIPFERSATARQLIPQAEFHAIDDAGHVPHYERPDQVNPLLLEFLRKPA